MDGDRVLIRSQESLGQTLLIICENYWRTASGSWRLLKIFFDLSSQTSPRVIYGSDIKLVSETWKAVLTQYLRCVQFWPTSAFQHDSDTAAHAAAHFPAFSTRQCCRFRLYAILQILAISLYHSTFINNDLRVYFSVGWTTEHQRKLYSQTTKSVLLWRWLHALGVTGPLRAFSNTSIVRTRRPITVSR